jgi:hypothetical protein
MLKTNARVLVESDHPHNIVGKHGWTLHPSSLKSEYLYEHPDHPEDMLRVDGHTKEWEHSQQIHGTMQHKPLGSGDISTLASHLRRYHGKE